MHPCFQKQWRRGLLLSPFLLLLLVPPLSASENRQLRFIATGGPVLEKLQNGTSGGTMGAAVHLAYPLSGRDKPISTTLALVNGYNIFPAEGYCLQLIRFGFGIRLFYNGFKNFRPYFTHDITSLIFMDSREPHIASSFGILLGLGVDLPLSSAEKAPSLFTDLSWNLVNFHTLTSPGDGMGFLALSAGITL